MIAAQPEPFTFTTTAPLRPGWHRITALIVRRDIVRAILSAGEPIARRGILTGRRLDIAVIWYSHDGTDRGQLAPTVSTVRDALTAAGFDLTHANITARTRTTTDALRPSSPALAIPALIQALTPRVVVDVTTADD